MILLVARYCISVLGEKWQRNQFLEKSGKGIKVCFEENILWPDSQQRPSQSVPPPPMGKLHDGQNAVGRKMGKTI